MDVNNFIDNVEQSISQWRPRDVLRRTNWLYRVDVLRSRDAREMDTLKKFVDLYQRYVEKFIVWGHMLEIISTRRPNLVE